MDEEISKAYEELAVKYLKTNKSAEDIINCCLATICTIIECIDGGIEEKQIYKNWIMEKFLADKIS